MLITHCQYHIRICKSEVLAGRGFGRTGGPQFGRHHPETKKSLLEQTLNETSHFLNSESL
jgi:hypothetical protein